MKNLKKRKEEFSDYGGDYTLYCKNSGNKLPLITVVINSFEVFSETFSKLVDNFFTLMRDGSKYGIIFILTTSQINGVRSKIVQLCPNKISLQLPNAADYRTVINSKKGLVPSKFFGRGIIANEDGGYEFQTAYVDKKDNIFNYIRNNIQSLLDAYPTRAYRLPELPKLVTYEIVKDYLKSLDKIPVGYEIINKKVTYFDFTKNQANVVLAEEQMSCMNFIYGLVRIFSMFKNSVVQVLDFSELYDYENENVIVRGSDFNKSVNEMLDLLKSSIREKKYNFIFIIGISKYNSLLDNQAKKRLKMILNGLNKVGNTTFILSDSYLEYKNLSLEDWYKGNIDIKSGIWVGPGVGNQISIKVQDFDINARKINFPQMGVIINDGKYKIVKLLVEGYEEDEE